MGNKSAKLEQSSPAGTEGKKTSFGSFFRTRFKMCPAKQKKVFMKDQNSTTNRPQLPLPEGAKKEKENEWTEVLLQVSPSTPGEIRKEQDKPHAPPRKHRQTTSGSEQVHHYEQLNGQLQDSTERIPVQEEIIVPKKEPIHICDGTHKHCINIVNGKVIESTIPKQSSNPSNKTKSSSSLPDHEELFGKDEKMQIMKNRSSHSSLSFEKIPKYLSSTTEKLESYITRWRSFGSVLPNNKKVTNNSTNVENKMSGEESWDNTDRWAENVIESDIVEHIVPAVRKRSKIDAEKKKILKTPFNEEVNHRSENTNTLIDSSEVSTPAVDEVSNANKKSVGGMCEDLKTFPFKVRDSTNVFESDTFFTSEFLKRENEASSLQYQPYTNKPTHARRCTFKDDIENVDTAIVKEKLADPTAPEIVKTPDSPKKTKADNDELLANLQDFCNEFDKMNPKPIDDPTTKMTEKTKADKKSDELLIETLHDLYDGIDKIDPKVIEQKIDSSSESQNAKKEDRPHVTPRRKSGIGHSNLLKILQQNSPTPKSTAVQVDKSTEEKSNIPRAGIEVVEDKLKRMETDSPEVDEPKITPELKSIESSWQQLLKRDQEDSLSNVTEFESAISEQLDNSSVSEDDYKSINNSSKNLYPSR